MSQRRYGEQMEVRLELENEVALLKKQVTALKGDNKKMEREVENSKDQMKAQKGKYEDIIAGLRNQLASKQHLTGAAGNTLHSSHLRNSGNGHQLSSVNEVISPTRFPPRESATRTSHPAYKNDKNENRPFNGHQQDDHHNRNNTNQETISGFQEPTFSELMRLSAKVTDPNDTQCLNNDESVR
jgi:DNA repair exonuclease SbcCD ATPase subunit